MYGRVQTGGILIQESSRKQLINSLKRTNHLEECRWKGPFSNQFYCHQPIRTNTLEESKWRREIHLADSIVQLTPANKKTTVHQPVRTNTLEE